MMRAWLGASVTRLLRLASVAALVGLAVMCASLVWPRALPVIFAMSVGHVIGAAALGFYLLAILLDTRRSERNAEGHSASAPPASNPAASDARVE